MRTVFRAGDGFGVSEPRQEVFGDHRSRVKSWWASEDVVLGKVIRDPILVAVVGGVDSMDQSVELLEFDDKKPEATTDDDDWAGERLQ